MREVKFMAFTPGPWKAEYYSDYAYEIFAKDEDQTYIANINNENENSCGNAKLISAAPELLAACELIVKSWKENNQISDTEILITAQNAIDKAIKN